MAESSVNNIDGVPFWGHGTEENLLNNVTPTQNEQEEITDEEEVDATADDGDEEETETEPSSK